MKIAIAGGGIAGLATAIYLKSSNHKVTIFEKSDGFKSQGYGFSIKSFGVEILKSFGVFDELKSKGLPITSFNIYGETGNVIREIPEKVIGEMTGGAFPVSRAHLHAVLFKLVDQQVPVVFNKWITAISHLTETERITFNDGTADEFDLVIIAEGLRSGSRQLLCGGEGWYPTDIKYAASQINRAHNFKTGAAYTFKGLGKTISFFPRNENQIVIQGYFRNADDGRLQQSQIRKLLQKTFGHFAKDVTGILKSLQENDFIFYDSVAMVQLPQLAWERVVLIGDSAYSTTFLSGMGASLSLLGARLLTEQLRSEPDVRKALLKFQNQMLPITRQFQQNAFDNMKRELPQKKLQLFIANIITKFIPYSMMIKKVSDKLQLKEELDVAYDKN